MSDGGFIVTYASSSGNIDRTLDILATRFDASGEAVGNEFKVNTFAIDNQSGPHVATLADGGFIIVWTTYRFPEGSGYDVRGQLYNAQGEAAGGEILINELAPTSSSGVSALPSGGFVVVWTSNGQDGSASGVAGRVFDSTGNPKTDEFQINSYTQGEQANPAMAVLSSGNFVVAWNSEQLDGLGIDIVVSKFAPPNTSPSITSNGGGTSGGVSVQENITSVTIVTAADPDVGVSLSYSIVGGADAAKFNIDESSGALSFVSAPNFEAPTDSGANNVYDVTVQVSDGTLTDTQTIAVTVTNQSPETVTGTALDDVLIASADGEVFNAGLGTDTVSYQLASAAVIASLTAPAGNTGFAAQDGYASVENLTGSAFNDTLTGDANANTLAGLGGNDRLRGFGGNDVLEGGDGSDRLDGGSGADVLDGGSGYDTADYIGAAAGVTVNLGDPTQNTGEASGDTYISIENVLGSTYNDLLTGDSQVNLLEGGAGADVLNGGGGANDYASYARSSAGVTVSLANPLLNTGDAAGDTYIGIRSLVGSNYDDILIGDAQSNVLRGGAGGDVLNGGAGEDWADYTAATVGVTANLSDPSQNTGDAAGDTYISIDRLRGSSLNDTLIGDGEVNFLDGRDGADVLLGGGGTNDYAYYGSSTQGLTVSLADPTQNTGEASGDTYVGITGLIGSDYNDTLIGDDGDNVLRGGTGADQLIGREGSDAGDYGSSSAGLTVSLTDPTLNTGDAFGDTYDSIEDLRGSNYDDILIGDTGDNRLRGNDGADQLIGGAGSDTADYGASGGVTANLLDPTQNTGYAAGDTYVLIENLRGSSDADNLTGDSAANTLLGLEGNDILNGGDGDDLIQGGGGDDILIGGAGADRLYGGDGDDFLTGNAGQDFYDGGEGNDTIDDSAATSAQGISIDLETGIRTGGFSENLTSIENYLGSIYNDVIMGNASANYLAGNGGDDVISGAGGNDVIDGGAGNDLIEGGVGVDSLIGGAGLDTVSYASSAYGVVVNLAANSAVDGQSVSDVVPNGYFQDPTTGHYFKYVAANNLSWSQASSAAQGASLFGQQGYLATVTTQAEWNFIQTTIFTSVQDSIFLGGSDAAQEGDWRWTAGPEGTLDSGQGLMFWQGAASGVPQNGLFASWIDSAFQDSGYYQTEVVDYLLMYSYYSPKFSATRGDTAGVSAGGAALSVTLLNSMWDRQIRCPASRTFWGVRTQTFSLAMRAITLFLQVRAQIKSTVVPEMTRLPAASAMTSSLAARATTLSTAVRAMIFFQVGQATIPSRVTKASTRQSFQAAAPITSSFTDRPEWTLLISGQIATVLII